MPREDIEIRTGDDVTLHGHLYTPSAHRALPCLILCHGFSCVKEQNLPKICEALTSKLQIACITFDYRGFGASETFSRTPRLEIIPSVQISDIQDVITYAQLRTDLIDSTQIGLWGYSYGGGHALYLGAVDRRVKAVLAHVPLTDGWSAFHRLTRPDLVATLDQAFQADRLARAKGAPAATISVVDPEPFAQKVLPSKESFDFFSPWISKSSWENKVTARSAEQIRAYNSPLSHVSHIGPTPVLMTVATRDTNTAADMGLEAFNKLSEPKELVLLDATHYDVLDKQKFIERQVAFLKKTLCKEISCMENE